MSEYLVRYEWDEAGGWAVSVPSVRGVRTEGRTLDEARRNVREALSLFVEDAETARLIEDIHVPKRVRTAASRLQVYLYSLEPLVDADIRIESRDLLGVLAEGLRPRRRPGGRPLAAKPAAAVGGVRVPRKKGAYRDGTRHIYAQRLDQNHNRVWATHGRIAVTSSPGQQYSPVIASDGAGGAIIAWMDDRNGITNTDIYAQRISNSGNPVWTANGVPIASAPGSQWLVNITGHGDGAIITWSDARKGSGKSDIYAQYVGASGVVQWAADGVGVSTAGREQLSPQVLNDGVGGVIIAWWDRRKGTYEIFVQRVDQFGYLGVVAPTLTSVADVSGDLGGQVSLAWDRSYLDQFPHQTITHYSVWRGIDLASGGTAWEWLAEVPSKYLPRYSFTARTLADATTYKFLVSAGTAPPTCRGTPTSYRARQPSNRGPDRVVDPSSPSARSTAGTPA